MTHPELKAALEMECAHFEEQIEAFEEAGNLAESINYRGRLIAYLRVLRLIEYGVPLRANAEA